MNFVSNSIDTHPIRYPPGLQSIFYARTGRLNLTKTDHADYIDMLRFSTYSIHLTLPRLSSLLFPPGHYFVRVIAHTAINHREDDEGWRRAVECLLFVVAIDLYPFMSLSATLLHATALHTSLHTTATHYCYTLHTRALYSVSFLHFLYTMSRRAIHVWFLLPTLVTPT